MRKKIILALFALIAIAAGVGYFMPNEATIEEELFIDAHKAEVHKHVASLPAWELWWKGGKRGGALVDATYGPIKMGVGSKFSFKDAMGKTGVSEITESNEKSVTVTTRRDRDPMVEKTIIALSEIDGRTKVIWTTTYHNDAPPVINSYLLLIKSSEKRKEVAGFLSGLKNKVEKNEDLPKPSAAEEKSEDGEDKSESLTEDA